MSTLVFNAPACMTCARPRASCGCRADDGPLPPTSDPIINAGDPREALHHPDAADDFLRAEFERRERQDRENSERLRAAIGETDAATRRENARRLLGQVDDNPYSDDASPIL